MTRPWTRSGNPSQSFDWSSTPLLMPPSGDGRGQRGQGPESPMLQYWRSHNDSNRMGRGSVTGGCSAEWRLWCHRMEEMLTNKGYVQMPSWPKLWTTEERAPLFFGYFFWVVPICIYWITYIKDMLNYFTSRQPIGVFLFSLKIHHPPPLNNNNKRHSTYKWYESWFTWLPRP